MATASPSRPRAQVASRALWLALAAAALGIALWLHGPIAQWADYHAFADQRTWLGVPNAANVLSNLRRKVWEHAGPVVVGRALDEQRAHHYQLLFALEVDELAAQLGGVLVDVVRESLRKGQPNDIRSEDQWIVLVECVVEQLGPEAARLGLPGRIPPNDGGLAAGQLAVAMMTLKSD